ncbi:MAG TPA: dihydrofolate reductase family protein [Actinomycetota bacterium]|nr:dihydrofolate reductase family protein [Actinomycetota bacterium]
MATDAALSGGIPLRTPLEVLADDGPESFPLPSRLRMLYGSGFGFAVPLLYANFVQSIDGVVALRGVASPAPIISGNSAADRFVMALLRACADGVLVGAGTMRDTGQPWTHRTVFPELAEEFAELRGNLGLRPEPDLLLLSSSGRIVPDHPALYRGARVLTTAAGAERLASLPAASSVTVLSDGPAVDIAYAVTFLREQGYRYILSEAGPNVTGQLVKAGMLDELFVTVAPVLAGRRDGDGQGLVDGVRLLPERRESRELLSLRKHGSYLFLRYGAAGETSSTGR